MTPELITCPVLVSGAGLDVHVGIDRLVQGLKQQRAWPGSDQSAHVAVRRARCCLWQGSGWVEGESRAESWRV